MLEAGSSIRGYKVTDIINNGAYCNAFKVTKGGRSYFLKEYADPTEISDDFKPFVANQKRIIGILGKLSDSTETIVEHFVEDAHYYQVKELLKGGNLADWMERNTDVRDRFEAAVQLTRILREIHGAGLVHQDLKPGQVMVVSESPLKLVLTDFDWSVPNGNVVRHVGTPWYGYIDKEPSEKSDIFTLGIMICELLTGANPYQDCNDNLFEDDLWPRWVSGRKYKEPIELNPEDISRKVNQMILQCLSPEPSDRPTLDEILAVLENPQDIKRMATLAAGGRRLILAAGGTADRRDFKLCFPDVTDAEGNPVHMYVSHEAVALKLERSGEQLALSSPGPLSNPFRLNGKDLGPEPVQIKDGDTLELYSSKRGQTVVSFSLSVR